MARKTFIICDSCDEQLDPEHDGVAKVTVEHAGVKRQGDLCDECAGKIPTSTVAGQKTAAGQGRRERSETLEDALAVQR